MKIRLILLILVMVLQGCASVPEELRYQQPGLPLGSSSIQGIERDNTGFLSVDETLSILTIDGRYVDGYEGAYWKDKIAIYPGNHVVEVVYTYPDFLTGIGVVSFNAKEFTEYQFKFEFPFAPNSKEREEFNRLNNTDFDGPWARVWVEDLGTGFSLSHALIPLITITTIPIVL